MSDKFKKDEAVSKRASGVSEQVSPVSIKLGQYLELNKVSKSSKAALRAEAVNIKEVSLKNLKDKPKINGSDESESSVTEVRVTPKRGVPTPMMELLSKQIEGSNNLLKEYASSKKLEIKQHKKQFQLECERLDYQKSKTEVEAKRYNDDLEFRKKQHDDEIQMRKRQHDDEVQMRKKQHDDEIEARKVQQEKDEGMLKVLHSFVPLVTQLTEKNNSKGKKKQNSDNSNSD